MCRTPQGSPGHVPRLAAEVSAVTWPRPPGPQAACAPPGGCAGLVSFPTPLPGGQQDEEGGLSILLRGMGLGQPPRSCQLPSPSGFLFQEHAKPVLPRGFGTGCSFGLGFASPSFLQGWNLFVIPLHAQMPPPQRGSS